MPSYPPVSSIDLYYQLQQTERMKKIITIIASIVFLLVITLVIFNQFTWRSIETEIIIDAPSEKVWNVLMDHTAYPSWNPFIKHISGPTQQGGILNVTIQSVGNDPMQFEPIIITNKKQQEFRWKGKLLVTGLFDGEHYFILEEIGASKTKFLHGEQFTGLLSGVLLKMIVDDTEEGFQAMNKAIKEMVED